MQAIDFRLYLITDRKLFRSLDLFYNAVGEALRAGVKALQLREKDLGTRDLLGMAYRMRELTGMYNAELYINDRLDIAMAAGADGVHLGEKSIPCRAAADAARKTLRIGVSAHGQEQALRAERDGADFITLGPVFETPSKMAYGRPLGTAVFETIRRSVSIPVFAIGGIKRDRVDEVMRAGAYGLALISGIFAAEDINNETKEFMRLMK